MKSWFLFGADLGDPISTIAITDVGCMAGTMQGKVWMYSFDTKQVEPLCAYSDEGCRGVYLDEDSAYAVLNEGCRSWRRGKPFTSMGMLCFRSLDKKNTQSVKHVLQRGPWALVLFPISTTVINVTRQEHHHRAFKLFDCGNTGEVAPCDFDGESLILVDRTNPATPVFKLVQLERNEHVEVSSLPGVACVSLVKLWGPECLVYVAGGSTVFVYNYRKSELVRRLGGRRSGHRAEIIAADASDPTRLATLSCDAVVKVWDGNTGECTQTLIVPEANFFLGFPYSVCLRGRQVLVSADEGVFLLEFDAGA